MKNTIVSSSDSLAPVQTHKSTLARLLATENIYVMHQAVETAHFNLKTRQLVLPLWAGCDNYLYDMLVGHEVSHALHTNINEWKSGLDTVVEKTGLPAQIAMQYLNIVEDARIERLIKNKFPGLRRDFHEAYKVLEARKFFGDLTSIGKACFADRLNLYCKMGIHSGFVVPFYNAIESGFVVECGETKEFSEVVDLVIRIILWQQSENSQHPVASTDPNADADGDTENTDADGNTKQKKFDPNATYFDADQPGNKTNVPTPVTNSTMEKEIAKQLATPQVKGKSNSSDVIRIQVPKSHNAVIDYKRIAEDVSVTAAATENAELQTLINTPVRVADYKSAATAMSMAFDRKKSADEFHRTQTSKTGILDSLKMTQYRWNDDIFRKQLKVAKGKNHGVIILLDWSGSMSGILSQTVGQLFILSDFCRQSGIPFEVYAFTDQLWVKGADIKGCEHSVQTRAHLEQYTKDTLSLCPISLLNFLSHKMTAAEYEKGKSILNALTTRGWRSNNYNLGGTPTVSALFETSTLIADFQSKSNVQQMHTVILTDGCPSDTAGLNFEWQSKIVESGETVPNTYSKYYNANIVLDDPITGCSYDLSHNALPGNYSSTTPSTGADRKSQYYTFGTVMVPVNLTGIDSNVWIASDIIRRRTGSQVHWIGLNDCRACPTSRAGMSITRLKGRRTLDWKLDGYVTGTVSGFDSAIIINSNRFASTKNSINRYGYKHGGDSGSFVSQMQDTQEQLAKAAASGNRTGLQKGFMKQLTLQSGLRIVATVIGERLASR